MFRSSMIILLPLCTLAFSNSAHSQEAQYRIDAQGDLTLPNFGLPDIMIMPNDLEDNTSPVWREIPGGPFPSVSPGVPIPENNVSGVPRPPIIVVLPTETDGVDCFALDARPTC